MIIYEDIEFFDPIPGFPKYFASKEGNILSTKNNEGIVLKPEINKDGYHRICLYKDRKRIFKMVHRLIMLTFEGECPEGEEVDHINHIRTDNRFENLRYCTKSENMRNQIINGGISIYKKGKKKFRVIVQVYPHPAKPFSELFYTREEAERCLNIVTRQANCLRRLLLELSKNNQL